MGKILQHKRGLEGSVPSLAVGEIGFTTDTNKTLMGSGTGQNIELANKADVVAKTIYNQDQLSLTQQLAHSELNKANIA